MSKRWLSDVMKRAGRYLSRVRPLLKALFHVGYSVSVGLSGAALWVYTIFAPGSYGYDRLMAEPFRLAEIFDYATNYALMLTISYLVLVSIWYGIRWALTGVSTNDGR